MSSQLYDTEDELDIAISVHPEFATQRLGDYAWESRAEEFDRLVETSNCDLSRSLRFKVRRAMAGTLLGQGQVEDIRQQVEAIEAVVVFVDHPLSPIQQRNLEEALNAKVVDRTGLILEIFAARARTREGVMQVELASLNYQMGRLVRSWTHLERQRGGVGLMGGPGETQIELDRRMIRDKILSLQKDLDKVRRMRATQRAGRQRKAIPTVALVGYTNAGKSTLFNLLTQSGVYVADQLFATLDPTLRKLELPGGLQLMLSDTVGFVQELPHELVDAFRATLEEVIEADLILHVRDASDPMISRQGQVVSETLEQLGLVGDFAPSIVEVMNKKDLAPGIESFRGESIVDSRMAISAASGEGVDELVHLLCDWLTAEMHEMHLKLEHGDGRSLAFCHQHGTVISIHHGDEYVDVVVLLNPADVGRFVEKEGLHQLRK
ncbi:GTPase [Mariprofundus micogutta]|uniref:GTPase HflX n=1 Tax=Mariprofundus micogutta TaxID=1921010 RepID=A0A1L8CP41_9PROT|nr:GTPase HflX [Mariprofundus micogutta]GAV20695.1 GTPase [Mariprofundus micogutta]